MVPAQSTVKNLLINERVGIRSKWVRRKLNEMSHGVSVALELFSSFRVDATTPYRQDYWEIP